uniref:GST C-terminal domain-containing protein n=1 Tax=Aplanochytrium stocchinoi TaxID=215587 RepID=A0A7S3PHL0_9STRA
MFTHGNLQFNDADHATEYILHQLNPSRKLIFDSERGDYLKSNCLQRVKMFRRFSKELTANLEKFSHAEDLKLELEAIENMLQSCKYKYLSSSKNIGLVDCIVFPVLNFLFDANSKATASLSLVEAYKSRMEKNAIVQGTLVNLRKYIVCTY